MGIKRVTVDPREQAYSSFPGILLSWFAEVDLRKKGAVEHAMLSRAERATTRCSQGSAADIYQILCWRGNQLCQHRGSSSNIIMSNFIGSPSLSSLSALLIRSPYYLLFSHVLHYVVHISVLAIFYSYPYLLIVILTFMFICLTFKKLLKKLLKSVWSKDMRYVRRFIRCNIRPIL